MHYENPSKVQICLAPDTIQAQNMLMHNILNKNLMNDNNRESSLEEKLNTITQLDEHDFFEFLFNTKYLR